MPVSDIPRAEAGEVGQDRLYRAGLPGRAVEHDDGRQAAVHRWADFGHPFEDLGEQVRAAFREGVGEEDGGGARRAGKGAAEVVAEVFEGGLEHLYSSHTTVETFFFNSSSRRSR